MWDISFLVFGAVLSVIGWSVAKRADRPQAT